MSNKARNSKESILCDAKELLKILDTAIKRIEAIEPEEQEVPHDVE